MEGFVTLAHLLALFVVASSVMTKKLWEWLFRVSIGVSLILFIYGLMQLAGKLAIHQGATRIDTTIGNSAYLGGYMLFHIFLAGYLLFDYFSRKHKTIERNLFWPIFYVVAILADIFVLFETATRGAEIGFVAGLICFSVALVIFEKENKMLRRTGAGILIAIALFGGVFVIERKSEFVTRNESLSRLASFTDQLLTFDSKVICEGELRSRCLLWPMAFEGVKEKPILGWGQESFNYVFNKYYDPKMYSQEQWFDRTHNVFFDWLIAGGILGLLSYLSLFVYSL
jgi:O-antigen ligase